MRNSSKKTKTKRNKETHQKNLKTNVDAHTLATLGVNLYKSLQHGHIYVQCSQTHIMLICFVHLVAISAEEKSRMSRSHLKYSEYRISV